VVDARLQRRPPLLDRLSVALLVAVFFLISDESGRDLAERDAACGDDRRSGKLSTHSGVDGDRRALHLWP